MAAKIMIILKTGTLAPRHSILTCCMCTAVAGTMWEQQ